MKYLSKLKDKANKLKDEIYAIFLAFKDKRTPFYAKIVIGFTISYALSPIDLIPDFIPILGYLDDFILLPLLITISIKLIPKYILIECRNRLKENSQINKNVGLPATISIILIWIGMIGFVLFKLLK